MSRLVKDWQPINVDDLPVAPHRYKWDGSGSPDGTETSYDEWKAKVPYKIGEVIYIDRVVRGEKVAKRALIRSMTFDRDRFGDRREVYQVQVENKAGLFSKVFEWIYPGPIQRGYLLAGLAPDLEGKM